MKQVLMALIITAFAYSAAEAQAKCPTPVTKQKTVVKHKSVAHPTAVRTTKKTTTKTTACRMIPYQVCTILPDRRSVKCYTTTDSANQTQTGEATFYGPTGPMPGEVVDFKVRTIVVKGKSKGRYCKRNEANDATICYTPGVYLVRDENGYYSYGEASPTNSANTVMVK